MPTFCTSHRQFLIDKVFNPKRDRIKLVAQGRVAVSSLNGALVHGRPHILTPSLEALQDLEDESENVRMMALVCAALNRQGQALLAEASFDFDTTALTSFGIQYVLRPAKDIGTILAQRIATKDVIINCPPFCDVQESERVLDSQDLEIAVKAINDIQPIDPLDAIPPMSNWILEINGMVHDSLPPRRGNLRNPPVTKPQNLSSNHETAFSAGDARWKEGGNPQVPSSQQDDATAQVGHSARGTLQLSKNGRDWCPARGRGRGRRCRPQSTLETSSARMGR